jgi:hypothetical protein
LSPAGTLGDLTRYLLPSARHNTLLRVGYASHTKLPTGSHRAADHDGRIITIGQLVLFSTETGDAWLLDRTDFLAARLARDGEAEPIQIVDTAATFAIEWKGNYRINGPAFVYSDRDTGRVITIVGYPNHRRVPNRQTR